MLDACVFCRKLFFITHNVSIKTISFDDYYTFGSFDLLSSLSDLSFLIVWNWLLEGIDIALRGTFLFSFPQTNLSFAKNKALYELSVL